MQHSASLSKDIVDLFEGVRQQAVEYVDIFNLLRRRSRELESIKTEMQAALEGFGSMSDQEISQLRSKVEDILRGLGDRLDFVQELYKELGEIHQLRDSLVELKTNLQGRTVELDTVLHTIRSYLKKETEKEFHQQERRVASRLQKLEAELDSFTTRNTGWQEIHRREYSHLSDEMNRFKNKITETKFIVDETTKIVNETIDNAERNFNDKLKKHYHDVEVKITHSMEGFLRDSSYQKKIDRLGADIATLENRNRALENSLSTRTVLAMGSGIVALIMAFLSFFFR